MEEAAMVVAAEDTGKLKENVSEERAMGRLLFFFKFLLALILIFTHYYNGFNPKDIVKLFGDFSCNPRRTRFLIYSTANRLLYSLWDV